MRAIILFLTIGLLFDPSPGNAAEPPDRELIAALVEALDDPDGEVRQNVAIALANLGDQVIPALLEALQHAKPERRMGAAQALGQLRPVARSAVPNLMQALKDKDEGVRRQVSYTLSRIVRREPASVSPVSDRPLQVPPPDPTPAAPNTDQGGPR